VARQVDTLESIYFFEVGQAVWPLITVGEVLIHEMSNTSRRTGPNRFGNQCIRGSLVPLLDHRHDVHQIRLGLILVGHQLHKPDQLPPEECPDEDAPVEEGGLFAMHRPDVLPKVDVRLALAYVTLVEDPRY